MKGITAALFAARTAWSHPGGISLPELRAALGGTVYDIFASDWFYIGLTIVIFAALWLLVKGVERFER